MAVHCHCRLVGGNGDYPLPPTRCVIGLVVVWPAPFVSIIVPTGVAHQDSILAATTCLSWIPEALGRVQEEWSRTAAEQDAFEGFAIRLETMDPDTQPALESPKHGRMVLSDNSSQASVAMGLVRDAYRETVMAIPHYQEDYAESFFDNVSQEFGRELATALAQGETLTPQLQRALIEASHTGANERTSYEQILTTDYESLPTAKRRLRTLADTLSENVTNSRKSDPPSVGTHNQRHDNKLLLIHFPPWSRTNSWKNRLSSEKGDKLRDFIMKVGMYAAASRWIAYRRVSSPIETTTPNREDGPICHLKYPHDYEPFDSSSAQRWHQLVASATTHR